MFDLKGGLKAGAFSGQPLTFLSGPAGEDLSTCMQIHLLENGTRSTREEWQLKQLVNLLKHAYANSSFWKSRIPSSLPSKNILDFIPILTRDELNAQVKEEGALVSKVDLGSDVLSYPSSGSTGTPVRVFSMPQNARYNQIRSIAQYYIEGRSLNFNRTFIKPADGKRAELSSPALGVENFDSWIGDIGNIFSHGKYKAINFSGDVSQLIEELRKQPIGYLACLCSHMDLLIKKGGKSLVGGLNIKMWLHHSDNLDFDTRDLFRDLDIPIRSSYSCSEAGPIAIECAEEPGFYHLAHSNVILEEDASDSIIVNGQLIYRLLVTHLHSYATPLIRYDLGDFGKIHSKCPCGHDGTTLSNIYGRKKYFLKCRDGSLHPFIVFSKPMLDIIDFDEFFIYQLNYECLIVELAGVINASSSKLDELKRHISSLSRGLFGVSVKLVDKIDWSKNPKRIPFICYV